MNSFPDLPGLQDAQGAATLGMPVARSARLRTLKRIVYKVAWLFLRHQVRYNESMIEAIADLTRQQEELARGLTERMEFGFRQAFAEIGDHIALAKSDSAQLQMQIAQVSRNIAELADAIRTGASEMHAARAEASVVIDRVRRALPEPVDLEALKAAPSAWSDLYLKFEDAMRGDSATIKARLSPYVEDIRQLGTVNLPVLDVGCGRGDWLSVLADADIPSYGIDIDENSVARARQSKLDARRADAFDHLTEIDAGSLSVVTAFHLVEHLRIGDLIGLLDLSFRALMPGGLLIVETPNPENLVVGTSDFYLDPTHQHPIPPMLLQFLIGSRGFSDVTTRRLRRNQGWKRASDEALTSLDPEVARIVEILQERLLVGEDYAVIARRA